MGNLLRRYWMPIAAAAELDDRPIKAVRLMGEDLALYKDKAGNYGLVDRRCPHRGADLAHGIIDDCGVRCHYHGWLFDSHGRCLEQPFEEVANPSSRFKERIEIKAYPVESKAGILWAYLGPKPAPLIPDWDRYHDPGLKQVIYGHVPCNWFQCQENSIDPVHFEWLHARWSRALNHIGPVARAHLEIDFEEFDYGFVYRRMWEGESEQDDAWRVGRVCLWPNALYTGMFEWRVPIDDHNTMQIVWALSAIPPGVELEQTRIPYWTTPLRDATTGEWITTHSMNQDFAVWMGQGVVADRTDEHLGASDRGIILLRKRMLEQIEHVAAGGEPKATIRDPAVNHRIDLPRMNRHVVPTRAPAMAHIAGMPREIADQLEALWREYRRAGLRSGSAPSSSPGDEPGGAVS